MGDPKKQSDIQFSPQREMSYRDSACKEEHLMNQIDERHPHAGMAVIPEKH